VTTEYSLYLSKTAVWVEESEKNQQ